MYYVIQCRFSEFLIQLIIIFIGITSGTDKQSRKDTGTVKTHMGKRYPDSTQFRVYRGRVLVGQNMFTTADQRSGVVGTRGDGVQEYMA